MNSLFKKKNYLSNYINNRIIDSTSMSFESNIKMLYASLVLRNVRDLYSSNVAIRVDALLWFIFPDSGSITFNECITVLNISKDTIYNSLKSVYHLDLEYHRQKIVNILKKTNNFNEVYRAYRSTVLIPEKIQKRLLTVIKNPFARIYDFSLYLDS